MTELIFVRHGVTDWNREKRLQGHTDIALNQEGREQAVHVARALAHEDFDAFYSSDLKRALETAQNVAGQHGQAVCAQASLRERHYGVFEGVPQHQLSQRFPQAYAAWKAREPTANLPGGESLYDFYERISTYLRFLVRQHPKQRIFIATHGGVLDCVYRLCTGTPLSVARTWDLPNTGVNRINYNGKKFKLVVWADTQHLQDQNVPLETEHL